MNGTRLFFLAALAPLALACSGPSGEVGSVTTGGADSALPGEDASAVSPDWGDPGVDGPSAGGPGGAVEDAPGQPDVGLEPTCSSHEDCDDGIECTGDVCAIEGQCTNELVDGVCFIDGACYADDTVNVFNGCQICNPDVSPDNWTPRQGEPCDDGDPSTLESFCNKEVCQAEPPDETCGNGILEGSELCDGDCPSACPDGDSCAVSTMEGSPETCNVTCTATQVDVCHDSDGCCPLGCTEADDNDCNLLCGNWTVDLGETCDGDCPSACFSSDPCKVMELQGSMSTCDAACVAQPVTACVADDGCCPSGCTSADDADCALPYQCTVDIQVECVNAGSTVAEYQISVNAPNGYLEWNHPPGPFVDCGTPPMEGYGPCEPVCSSLGPLHFCDLETETCMEHQNMLNYCLQASIWLPLQEKSGTLVAKYWTGLCLVPEGGSPLACESTLNYDCP